jgi:hypothetical protein
MQKVKTVTIILVSTFCFFTSCKRKHLPDEFTPVPVPLSEFQMTYGGSGDELIYSIIESSDSNYVVAGITTTLSNGDWDMYLAKIDQSGNLLWNKAIGGADVDKAFDVIETPDKGYLLAGFTNSFSIGNGFEVYVVKTDESGNVQWQKTFGDINNDCAKNIILSKDNDGYIITGGTNGYLIQLGTLLYIAKINFNGDTLWTKTYAGPTSEIGNSVCYDNSGNLMILGSYWTSGPQNNLFVLQLNSNGDTTWTKSFGGVNREDAGNMITSGNDFVICATTASFGEPNGDVYLLKINSSGDKIWKKTFGGSLADMGNCVISTSDNNYLVAGSKTDSTGYMHALLLKTDLNGNLKWEKTFGDTANFIAYKTIETSDAYLIAGSKQLPSGSFDAFVMKIKKQ